MPYIYSTKDIEFRGITMEQLKNISKPLTEELAEKAPIKGTFNLLIHYTVLVCSKECVLVVSSDFFVNFGKTRL